jgi:integrase
MIIAGTFDLAIAGKIRRDNPAREDIITPPQGGEPLPRDLWDASTVWRVINGHPEQYRVVPVCEVGMGLRQGCAFALAEEDFDFKEGKARIRRQIAYIGTKYYFKLPKGGKERVVPMSRGVASYIQRHIAKHPPLPYSLPWMNEDGRVGEPHTCRLLALSARGHLKANSYDRVWLRALHEAGIGPEPTLDKYRNLVYRSPGREKGQHILRHIFETVLDEGGVSMAGRMEFMGHSLKGQPITLRVYGHVTENAFEQARLAVDSWLFYPRPADSSGTVTELRPIGDNETRSSAGQRREA